MNPGNSNGYPYSSGEYRMGSYAPQPQKMINKQQQTLVYSYETLGHLLSSAENFAGFPNQQYSNYNVSSATNHDELKSEFAWELHCFQLALKSYKKKFGEYIYPMKYPKEKIIKDCQRYILNTPNQKDKILFVSMINIINGEKVDIDFDRLFEKLDKSPDKNFDPRKLVNIIGPLNHILSEIEKEAEEGEINFNEGDKKKRIRNKLKEESESNAKLYLVYCGIKGYLSLQNQANYYCFQSEDKKIEIQFFLNEVINDRNKKLYNIKNDGKEAFIYINNTLKDFYEVSLFENDLKKFPKSELVILDNKNGYGYINLSKYKNVPILLYEDTDFK